ncbi:MAG: flagellar basal body P-ring protein FlgI [Pirellulales bacterium]
MKPSISAMRSSMQRREFLALGVAAGLTSMSGCAGSLIRGQNPELDEVPVELEEENVRESVGDISRPWGNRGMKVESIALVNNLAGTGSNPPPGPQRQALIDEMQARSIPNPNEIISSPNTSLALVRAVLPPGVKKGDRIDLEVRTPSRSETVSLRNGWLMQCRLREMEVLGGKVSMGHITALGEGHVLVESLFQGKESKVLENRAVIPGGGISHTNRTMGLTIREDHHSIQTAAMVAASINARFHNLDAAGGKSQIANAKRDNFIELQLHPRYELNIGRYFRVIQNIVLREPPKERPERLEVLRRKLLEPTSTERASWQLEAIGKEAIPALKAGLDSPDKEVRFNAAEALAYLDVPEAAKHLAEAARDSVAFRWAALAALASMGPDAFDSLSDLLHVPSIETRYGAFRALSQRRQVSPLVRGIVLGEDQFSFHVVQSMAEPVIHFARTRRPELVLFGAEQRIKPPPYLFINRQILIKAVDDRTVRITQFHPGEEDREETCSTELAQIIPIVVRMGATYLDLLVAFRNAKKDGLLDSRIAVEALPRPGRTHVRDEEGAEGDETSEADESPSETDEAAEKRLAAPDVFERDGKTVEQIDFNNYESSAWDRFLSRWFGVTTE